MSGPVPSPDFPDHIDMPPYLLSRYAPFTIHKLRLTPVYRGLDPILGIFTGLLGFYLHETHPRTARPEEQRLMQLLKWKYTKFREQRRAKLLALDNSA